MIENSGNATTSYDSNATICFLWKFLKTFYILYSVQIITAYNDAGNMEGFK